MLDISWTELFVVAVVAILVIGPRDLPRTLRSVGNFVGQARRMAGDFQRQFDQALREAELDEVKQSIDSVRKADPRNQIRDVMKDVAGIGKDLKKDIEGAGETGSKPAGAVGSTAKKADIKPVDTGAATPAPKTEAASKSAEANTTTAKPAVASAKPATRKSSAAAKPAAAKTAKAPARKPSGTAKKSVGTTRSARANARSGAGKSSPAKS